MVQDVVNPTTSFQCTLDPSHIPTRLVGWSSSEIIDSSLLLLLLMLLLLSQSVLCRMKLYRMNIVNKKEVSSIYFHKRSFWKNCCLCKSSQSNQAYSETEHFWRAWDTAQFWLESVTRCTVHGESYGNCAHKSPRNCTHKSPRQLGTIRYNQASQVQPGKIRFTWPAKCKRYVCDGPVHSTSYKVSIFTLM